MTGRQPNPGALAIVVVAAGLGVVLVETMLGATTALVLVFIATIAASLVLSTRQRQWTGPRLLSPTVVVWAPPIVAAGAYLLVGDPRGLTEYLGLVALEAAGLAVGPAVAKTLRTRPLKARLSKRTQRHLVRATWFAGAAAALVYVAHYGSPLAAANVEVARAGASDGYLRVVAQLSVPASVCAYALRMRGRLWYVLGAAGIVAVFGNRSPLVYLFGAVVLGEVLLRTQRRVASSAERRQRWSPRKANLVLLGGFALVLVIVLGGAVLRVVKTPEYANYSEYSTSLDQGDYASIATWNLAHYAKDVGDNMLLTKHLVDWGKLPTQYGASYLSPIVTALPGQQETLDLQIKDAAGSTFIGGGIPPTLVGEGFVNFGFVGVFLAGALLSTLVHYWSRRALAHTNSLDCFVYGFVITYAFLAQVAGFAGASTLPPIFFVVLVLARWVGIGSAPASEAGREQPVLSR
jgi:hypothetical protein